MAELNAPLGWYAREIQRIANCSKREAELLEEIMRQHVFHSQTLDWIEPEPFRVGVTEAVSILNQFSNAGNMPQSWRRFLAGEQVLL